MQNINWNMVGPAFAQVLFNITVASLFLTVFGALLLKYFVRQVPILSCALLFFWALFRVLFVVSVLYFLTIVFALSMGALSGVFSLVGMCMVGWLITRDLGRLYGVPTKFPAVGAKVMGSLFILGWLVIIAAYLIFYR